MTDKPLADHFRVVRRSLRGGYPDDVALASLDAIAERQHETCAGCIPDGRDRPQRKKYGTVVVHPAVSKKCAALRAACKGDK